jgi:hypothetical protein
MPSLSDEITNITINKTMIIMAVFGKSEAFFKTCLTEQPIGGLNMLDDLFEGSKHNRHSDNYGRTRNPAGYGDERDGHYNPLLNLVQKLLRNKVLLAGIVLTILIIGAVGIWLIVTLLPYLGQIISMAEKQGIKGILEGITPFLQKIWEGTGK